MQEEIEFHTERAMSELKVASTAANPQAARAHLRLSGLHLERLRELTGTPAAGALSRPAGPRAA